MAWLNLSLGICAGVIFALYSIYVVRIIMGKPEEFELNLLQSLAGWMIERGANSRTQMWLMLFASLILEILYFLLVLIVIKNPALLFLTGALAAFEMVHFGLLFIAFYQFFQGKLMLKDIFRWKMERISAVSFFTHALLVLFNLLLFV